MRRRPSTAAAPTRDGAPASRYRPWDALAATAPHLAALRAISIDLAMAAGVEGADLVHSHTWYANFAGHLAKLLYGIPHVATAHSLEPLRPWKAEQLGGGYALSCFCERTALEAADAIIAVSRRHARATSSHATRRSTRTASHVIHNGIDTDEYAPDPGTDVLERHGVDPARPVRRLRRADHAPEGRRAPARRRALLRPRAPSSCSAPARRTRPRSAPRSRAASTSCSAAARRVFWIDEMLPKPDVIQILSHATVFACPSIYEPLGIVNLEAMACEAAVVATATGGIPEVVDDGETGLLVPIEPGDDGTGEPRDPDAFAAAFAERRQRAGRATRRAPRRWAGPAARARVERFAWPAIAQETVALYQRLL